MTSKPEPQEAPQIVGPSIPQQQQATEMQQRQFELSQHKPQVEDYPPAKLSSPMIYTVEKGADALHDFLLDLFRGKNGRLRNKITQLVEDDPELQTVVDNVASKQPADASPKQVQANLQERAQAIIASRPDLESYLKE